MFPTTLARVLFSWVCTGATDALEFTAGEGDWRGVDDCGDMRGEGGILLDDLPMFFIDWGMVGCDDMGNPTLCEMLLDSEVWDGIPAAIGTGVCRFIAATGCVKWTSALLPISPFISPNVETKTILKR